MKLEITVVDVNSKYSAAPIIKDLIVNNNCSPECTVIALMFCCGDILDIFTDVSLERYSVFLDSFLYIIIYVPCTRYCYVCGLVVKSKGRPAQLK